MKMNVKIPGLKKIITGMRPGFARKRGTSAPKLSIGKAMGVAPKMKISKSSATSSGGASRRMYSY